MDNTQTDNKMGRKSILSLLITLGIPTILSLVLQSIYNLVDTAFVANIPEIGQKANVALTCAFPIQLLIIAFGVGTGIGINALLSKAISENDKEKVSRIIGNSIFILILMYVVFLVVGLTCSRALMEAQSSDPDVIEMGTSYMLICCSLSFGTIGYTTFERFLQAAGHSLYSMIAQVSAAVLNIILDYVFIYPCNMGIAGAAWATVTSQIFSFVLVIIFQFTINKEAKIYSFKHISPKGDIFAAIYKVGWSAILMQGLLSIMMFGLNLILGTANPAVVDINTLIGSFGIYYKVMQVALYIAFGFSNTMITLLSFNYGLQDKERVKQCIRYGLIITVVLMAVVVIIFEACAYPISWLFGFSEGNNEFISIVTRAIRIGSIGYIFMGICVTIQGIFQGLGMAVRPLIISLLRFAVLIMPISYLFLLTSDPLNFWWWAFPITETISVIVSIGLLIEVYHKFIKTMPDRVKIDTNHLIVTISRQHGSNGREIATKLADRLGVPFFDKEILAQNAEETGLDEKYLQDTFGDHSNFRKAMISKEPNQAAIIKEAEIIKNIANTTSCVILGRAADYFLRDYQIISIYIWADEETRIENTMRIYGDSREEALKSMAWSDRGRSWYYTSISGRNWGEPSNYDLSIDSSVGVDKVVDTLYEYIKDRYENKKEADLIPASN